MPRQASISIENNFSKGLITEATGLNFPENACTETFNCVFHHTGEVDRRLGIDYEESFEVQSTETDDNAVREFLWKSVAKNGEFTFVVLQVGATLNFYSMSSTSISPTRKDFTVDLEDFRVMGSPAIESITCSFDAGNGYLFVTHPYLEPFYVAYDSDTDDITSTAIELKIRDFEGVEDDLGVDERPLTLSKEHHYNLLNQGWGPMTPCTATQVLYITASPLQFWRVGQPGTVPPPVVVPPRVDFPSNSDVWWTYKTIMRPVLDEDGNIIFPTPLEAFSLIDIDRNKRATSPAPRGYFLLTAWHLDRASVTWPGAVLSDPAYNDTQGSLDGIPIVSSGYQRPSVCAFYAGRVWYAGINSEKFNTKLYFSKIIEKNSDFGLCHQVNDPTGEEAADLLASDGGVIQIPAMAQVIKLHQMGNSLLIFCTNGTWKVDGSQGLGFTATDYSISKISPIGALSETSFVDVEGAPIWWNHDGIWTVKADQSGAAEVSSLSFSTIQSFVDDIPSNNIRYVKGAYNPLEKRVQWLYRSNAAETIKENFQYNRILNLALINQAFYPWSLEDNCNKIVGIFTIQGVSHEEESEVVTDVNDVTVTTGAGDVTVGVITHQDIASRFKYITTSDCFVDDGESTVDYNKDFLGNLTTGTFGSGIVFPSNNGVMFGEDGEIYTYADEQGAFIVNQIQKFDGTGTKIPYTLAAFRTDVETATGTSGFTWSPHRFCILVPFTQYFYYLSGTSSAGPNYDVALALYKINAGGAIEFVAAQMYDTGFSPYYAYATQLKAVAVDYKGQPTAEPRDQQLLVALSNSVLGTSKVLELQSVNDFIGDTGLTTGSWVDLFNANITESDTFFNRQTTASNSAFFLPVNNGGWDNLLCTYVPYTEAQWAIDHSPGYNTVIESFAIGNPTGFVLAAPLFTGTWEVFNSHFKAEDTTDLVPFADLGLNKDDSVGSLDHNDWANPTVQHDITSGLSLILWGRKYDNIELNQEPTGAYAKALFQTWDPVAQSAAFLMEVEGSPLDTVIDLGVAAPDRYGSYPVEEFFFLSEDKTQLYVYLKYTTGSVSVQHLASLFGDVELDLIPPTTGLTFSEFSNDNYLDWQASGESDDFSSYFITGYKVHGDAIRKFQSNYTQLYTRNDVFSVFDFQSRWDYAISGDTGRWANKQRITMDDVNYKFRSRRVKNRGHGRALQYKVNSVTTKPFNIVGWASSESGNASA